MAVTHARLLPPPLAVHADTSGYESLLTPPALEFLADLHQRFEPDRQRLLHERRERQATWDAGALPDFRADTRSIREGNWVVAPVPAALADRRVEITGPVERKMIINALNSGAKVFMADFEDSSAPTFANQMDGQINLRDAVDGTLAFTSADGRQYRVQPDSAVLMVRPRGWHLPDKHFTVDGQPVAGALVDFALFAFHNARALAARDRGPYFYLPKLEAMEEAALWEAVMSAAETGFGLESGCMKATVLIETLPAAFQMHEILHALRQRAVGLNCGRWDYIFSYLKTLRGHRDRLLPERAQIGMTAPFLKSYSELLIHTCHHRGAFAMGGMAAQIPIKGDGAANDAALAKVRTDKLREVLAGHDGTWVAHPALVGVAQAVFDEHMHAPNQLEVLREDVQVDAAQLLAAPAGTITRTGFDNNVEVCLRYTAAWLGGLGCVPLHHLMEDAATAEIARAQLWQWLHHADGAMHGAGTLAFDDGAPIDMALFDHALATHSHRLRTGNHPGAAHADAAAALIARMTHADQLGEFLTVAAYQQLT
ncbi:MAG: malate synthase A [Rhodanobacter sp.]